jgi:hypothetical protein
VIPITDTPKRIPITLNDNHYTEWERDLTSLPSNHTSDNLLVNRILDGQTDEHTRFIAETLNPKPGHTQEDTHYTEWYPDIEGNPLHWVIPITLSDTDTLSSQNPPKSSPITLRDPVFLTNRPDTKWYPWHWGISLTRSDTQYPGWERTAVWQGKDRLTDTILLNS